MLKLATRPTRREIGSYYDLLAAWTARTVRARYQQSFLGGLWAIAQPAATALIFTFIFTRIVPVETEGTPYVLFSFSAMLPWTFFTGAMTDMALSLVDNKNLVSKIYFPREVLPLAAMLAKGLDFAISILLLVGLMVYYQAPLFPTGWLFVPLIVGTQVALTIGLGLICCALNVFYRDVRHLVELSLRLLMYLTPIIYPAAMVPEHLRDLFFLNPMAGLITSYRDVLLYQRVPGSYLGTAVGVSLVTLVAGIWFFKRVEDQFADVV